jgi:hypothetical protein
MTAPGQLFGSQKRPQGPPQTARKSNSESLIGTARQELPDLTLFLTKRLMPAHLVASLWMALVVLAASSTSAFAPAGIGRSALGSARISGVCTSRQLLRRRSAARGCRIHMSAARGDACLAAAATALGAGDYLGAQENLDKARMEYMRAGKDFRPGSARVASARSQPCGSRVSV